MKRREVIKSLSVLPFAGSMANQIPFNHKKTYSSKLDLFAELGISPVINANVTMTFLSGSLMQPEVLEAIQSTSQDFANMFEVQDKVGAKIAEMLRVEAAMVTSGAACALTLGTAACITGSDAEKIKQLPNLPGEMPEVIIQKSHRYPFDQAVACAGVKLIEVEGPDDMQKAINERTVMGLFLNCANEHSISHEQFVEIGKANKIPVFIDAAADVPPVENLFKFQKMGFDLITFSGGKMIRGPQSAGLLFGRKDLIEAAKLNHSPHESPIGRAMKVNKEEMFGMYVALKSYLERDHEKEWNEWLGRAERIKSILEKLPGVQGSIRVSPGPANAFPSLRVNWERDKISKTVTDVLTELENGNPKIVAGGREPNLNIGVVLLRPDQVDLVANRVKDILQMG
ncbi:aminotransferase class V-fold PLP-dependent enzyme [Olivibacter sitiensis]|uniref:aminotransferase class V-fold PLP-dependent enzyme n=1 Tax=Olivibacter sitiensis TaxID=376470 RepID=UPI000409CC95|nr:aminotransferase class V-fold PLP-dependent enzyme [Olivibacter sitiensis]